MARSPLRFEVMGTHTAMRLSRPQVAGFLAPRKGPEAYLLPTCSAGGSFCLEAVQLAVLT